MIRREMNNGEGEEKAESENLKERKGSKKRGVQSSQLCAE